MSHHASPLEVGTADAGAQLAQLGHVLGLVREMAGRPLSWSDQPALDRAARVSAAYAAAMPIVQRRFDSLAAETAGWTAAGVEALMALSDRGRPSRAAAEQLARDLAAALRQLSGIVGD
jgi:hypothetical protein